MIGRRPAALVALVVVDLLGGCGATVSPSRARAADEPARTADRGRAGLEGRATGACFSPAREAGRVASPELAEISGMVASRQSPGILWVHNDSGSGPSLYAIDQTGVLAGEWDIEGAPADDWEDIAIEVVADGPDRLWIGDIGDNGARNGLTPRDAIVLVRIDEPVIDLALAPAHHTITRHAAITLRYPEGAHDSEAIAIDPTTGDLFLFAKEDGRPSDVFRVRAPLPDEGEAVLERFATIDTGSMVTAADVDLGGRELLVRTYRSVLSWERGAGETWVDALARGARIFPRAPEPQGEAIAFAGDAASYFTISEGEGARIWRYDRGCE